MQRVAHDVEVPMFSYRARRPNGDEVFVCEYWRFVDMSPRRTGTSWVPGGGKRRALRTGEPVRLIEDGVFQLTATSEILTTESLKHSPEPYRPPQMNGKRTL